MLIIKMNFSANATCIMPADKILEVTTSTGVNLTDGSVLELESSAVRSEYGALATPFFNVTATDIPTPVAIIKFPSVLPLCSAAVVQGEVVSGAGDGNVTWQWDIEGENLANDDPIRLRFRNTTSKQECDQKKRVFSARM